MKTKFTKEYIVSNRGCYSIEQVEALSFINKEEIAINDFIDSEIPLKDKYWWLIRKCELTSKECVKIAVDLAEIVLPIYENKYKSKAPRQAIELTKKWLRGEEVTQQEHNAYVDAYASAYSSAAAAAYNASCSCGADDKYMKQVEDYLNKFKI